MAIPRSWTEFFFYPITPSHCPTCAYPGEHDPIRARLEQQRFAGVVTSAASFSYTWGHSRSPAYAFKTRDKFDEGLRVEIARLFSWMVWRRFRNVLEDTYVVGVPPRRSFRYGTQSHLDDLLHAVEEVNIQVLHGLLAFDLSTRPESLIVADSEKARRLPAARVVVIDNLWKTGGTARQVALKILELGATYASEELHC